MRVVSALTLFHIEFSCVCVLSTQQLIMCLRAKRKYISANKWFKKTVTILKIEGWRIKKKGFWSLADMSDFVFSFMEPICCAITQMKFRRKFFVQRSIVSFFLFYPFSLVLCLIQRHFGIVCSWATDKMRMHFIQSRHFFTAFKYSENREGESEGERECVCVCWLWFCRLNHQRWFFRIWHGSVERRRIVQKLDQINERQIRVCEICGCLN